MITEEKVLSAKPTAKKLYIMTEQNIQAHKRFKILLIGDKGKDTYTFGKVERISPEAPVPVFVPTRTIIKPGMADNVRLNLETLGCDVTFIFGDVSEKERLIDEKSKQQVLRIDKDKKSVPLLMTDSMFKNYDAVVISDYGKGTVTYELIEQAINNNKIVFIDTKKTDLERFQGAWVKINELEYSKIKSECTGLIVTMGSKGCELVHHDYVSFAPSVDVVDVVGAGDTFLSALAYMYLQTTDIKVAMEFANRASAVTVQHFGCYAPQLKEIQ